MNGFILRITAHHGEPKLVGNLHVRAGISVDTPVASADVINDVTSLEVKDLNAELRHENDREPYNVDDLIADFQDEYGCKIAYGEEIDPQAKDGNVVHEFDIFEPSWPEPAEAEDVIEDLTRRLVDWVNGYPAGR
jgi:hypothetical protein